MFVKYAIDFAGARLFPNSSEPLAEFKEAMFSTKCREKLRGLTSGEKRYQIRQLKRAAELAGSAGESTLSSAFASAAAATSNSTNSDTGLEPSDNLMDSEN